MSWRDWTTLRGEDYEKLYAMTSDMADAIVEWHRIGSSGSRLSGVDGPLDEWKNAVEELRRIAEYLNELKSGDGN